MRKFSGSMLLLAITAGFVSAQVGPAPTYSQEGQVRVLAPRSQPISGDAVFSRIAPSVVLILTDAGTGQTNGLGSGFIVRSDGVLLTANHVIKDAREVQVRLKNGEVYDKAYLLAADERRDIAVLKIAGYDLPAVPLSKEETAVGGASYVVSHPSGLGWTVSSGIVSGLRMADDVPGAGSGHRLIQFTAPVSPGSSGGVLVNGQGEAIGLVLGNLVAGQNVNFALPIRAAMGLIPTEGGTSLGNGKALVLPQSERSPDPEDPKRVNAGQLTRAARTVCVTSQAESLSSDLLINALHRRPELDKLGLMLTTDCMVADIDLLATRPFFTFDFVFTARDRKTNVVLATGKTTAMDGIRAAPVLAEQFMKQMGAVREEPDPPKLKQRAG
jgi:S1-C subfamily serine protease